MHSFLFCAGYGYRLLKGRFFIITVSNQIVCGNMKDLCKGGKIGNGWGAPAGAVSTDGRWRNIHSACEFNICYVLFVHNVA